MSGFIPWMAAEGEGPEENLAGFNAEGASGSQSPHPLAKNARRVGHPAAEAASGSHPGLSLPAHQFPGKSADAVEDGVIASESQSPHPVANSATRMGQPADTERWWEQDPEEARRRRVYRGRTVGMLRRYMQYAMETGRLPSLLGREFFRAKVTSYTVVTFEDRVIFVHDMEICLERLDEFSRQVLKRVILQEYEHGQAAQLLGCTRMTVHRKLLETLDRLSDILLEVGLLEALPANEKKPCQEGETANFPASDCEEGK